MSSLLEATILAGGFGGTVTVMYLIPAGLRRWFERQDRRTEQTFLKGGWR